MTRLSSLCHLLAFKMRNLILVCLLSSVGSSPTETSLDDEFRIINGDQAELGQFPWQAGILFTRTDFTRSRCGGALISDRWILTAAHCIYNAWVAKVSLGSNVLDGMEPNSVKMKSTQLIIHEKYNWLSNVNDIALIKLPQPVNFTDYIQTIDLAQSPMYPNTKVTVSGWGYTKNTPGSAPFLNHVSLITIGDRECRKIYKEVKNGSFCAGQMTKLNQAGDSGGPVVTYDDNGKATHVGIVSFGQLDGCKTGKPDGFTSTYFYRQWIKEKTGI